VSDDTETVETKADEEQTLYEQIVAITDMEFDSDDESHEEYKDRLVKWFSDQEDEVYDNAPEAVQEWIDEATKIAKANRGAKRKKPLPVMDGLEGDEAAESEPEEKPKVSRGAKKAAKEPKEPKERGPRASNNNRYYKIGTLMVDDSEMDVEQLKSRVSKSGLEYADRTIERAYEAFRGIYTMLEEKGLLRK
jgi:hypothetical protein